MSFGFSGQDFFNIHNRKAAYDFLNAGKPRTFRKLNSPNVIVQKTDDDSISVSYYGTAVVVYNADDSVSFFTGGYRTMNTKALLNLYGPKNIRVWQTKGQWTVAVFGGAETLTVPFAEGITINADGTVTGAMSESEVKAEQKLIKRINKYSTDYVNALLSLKIAPPSGADCWDCLMRHKDGTVPMDQPGHLLMHMDEKYYPASLIMAAIDSKVSGVSNYMQWGLGEIWTPHTRGSNHCADTSKEQYTSMIRRFMKRQFNIASR